MTNIEQMAREAGLLHGGPGAEYIKGRSLEDGVEFLAKFAALIAEDCARLYEKDRDYATATYYGDGRRSMAEEIRTKYPKEQG